MGTTVVACVVRGEEAVAARVGGSRLYQIRGGEIVFATADHTQGNEPRNTQLLTHAEQSDLGISHTLTPSLGSSAFVHVDTITLPIRPGDRFVLCTGGVYKAMYDDEIARIASKEEHPQGVADEIVQHAIAVDGSDNATAQVIRIESIENAADSRRRAHQVA